MTGQRTPTRGALRIIRGVVLAGTSAALAVAAHAVGGGMLPDPALTALLTVGVAAVGIALADRRRGHGTVLVVLGVAQLTTHVLLSLADTGMAGMSDDVNPLVMTAAHAVAVLVAAGLLSTADAVVFRLAGLLLRLVPSVLVAPPVPPAPVRPRCDVVPPGPAMSVLLRLGSPRRGPPSTA